MEPIAMVMRRRRLEWFGHVKRRCATENIRAVVEMKMVMIMRRLEWFGHVKRRCATENIRAVVEMDMEGSALEEDRRCYGKTLSEVT